MKIFWHFMTSVEGMGLPASGRSASARRAWVPLAVGTLIYRRIALKDLPVILRATAVDTAAVMFIVAALILLLLTITYVPSIVLWLPRLAMS